MEPNINTDLTLKVKPPEDLTLSCCATSAGQ
jgi:hypothetical protein